MRILVLGGTRFVGKHAVAAALERGHHVTLFNRGLTDPSLFPDAEHRRGDRDGDLSELEHGWWDAVVDTSGYFPRQVETAADVLGARVSRYLFVSSISAYQETAHPGLHEDAPMAVLDDPAAETTTTETYGALKAECERLVLARFRSGGLIVRPGLIVGPDDPSDRFSYWVARLLRGGDILAPAPPERPIQIIDVRDLGTWIVHLLEEERTGAFNAVGPAWPLSMGVMLEIGAQTLPREELRVHWTAEPDLLGLGVEPWTQLPLWIPSGDPHVGFRVDPARALRAGLRYRPLPDTFRATHDWMAETGRLDGPPPRRWLTTAREQEILERLAD